MRAWLREARTFPESGRKLESKAQDSETLWDCVVSLRPSGRRVERSTHLPALVAMTQTPINTPLERRLSWRDAARLRGLPETCDCIGQRDPATFKQLGSRVNTAVHGSRAIGHGWRALGRIGTY
jgi:DNA (cytosine-5)-methyltransferase 1